MDLSTRYLGLDLRKNLIELSFVCEILSDQPVAKQLDRVALGHPALFLLLWPVFPIHIANVMAAIPIRIAQKKCWTLP